MAPMRDFEIVESFHEPVERSVELQLCANQGRAELELRTPAAGQFMFPMRDFAIMVASHEPPPKAALKSPALQTFRVAGSRSTRRQGQSVPAQRPRGGDRRPVEDPHGCRDHVPRRGEPSRPGQCGCDRARRHQRHVFSNYWSLTPARPATRPRLARPARLTGKRGSLQGPAMFRPVAAAVPRRQAWDWPSPWRPSSRGLSAR